MAKSSKTNVSARRDQKVQVQHFVRGTDTEVKRLLYVVNGKGRFVWSDEAGNHYYRKELVW